MIHYVYKIINLENNLYYIGSRSYPLPENDLYMGSSKIMNNLYKIKGIENFKKEILFKFNTRREANIKEDELVIYSLTKEPHLTYNLKPSGVCNENDRIWNRRNDIWVDFYEEIRKKYSQGYKPNNLATSYNCDRGTIDIIIRDLKIDNKWSSIWKFKDEAILDYKNGFSRKYLSKKYKCDIGTVKTFLIKNNIIIRSIKAQFAINKEKNITQGKKKIIDLKKFKDLYLNQDLTMLEVSKILGLYTGTLRNFAIENNIPLKTRGHNNRNRHIAWKERDQILKDIKNMNKKEILIKYNIKDYITLNKILLENNH